MLCPQKTHLLLVIGLNGSFFYLLSHLTDQSQPSGQIGLTASYSARDTVMKRLYRPSVARSGCLYPENCIHYVKIPTWVLRRGAVLMKGSSRQLGLDCRSWLAGWSRQSEVTQGLLFFPPPPARTRSPSLMHNAMLAIE